MVKTLYLGMQDRQKTSSRSNSLTNKQCTRKSINLSNSNPNRNLMSRRRSAAQRGQLSRKNVSNKPKMVKTLVTYYKRLGCWCLAGRLGWLWPAAVQYIMGQMDRVLKMLACIVYMPRKNINIYGSCMMHLALPFIKPTQVWSCCC